LRALVLDGARGDEPEFALARAVVGRQLADSGWGVDATVLRDLDIAGCRGCFGCWVRTPGQCVADDAGREVARAAAGSDLLVWLTPVTFGGYSSELKKALDRLIPSILPFFTTVNGTTRHKLRYDKAQSIAAVGLIREPDEAAETVFRALVEHNAANFHSPGYGVGIVRAGAGESEMAAVVRGTLRAAGVAQ